MKVNGLENPPPPRRNSVTNVKNLQSWLYRRKIHQNPLRVSYLWLCTSEWLFLFLISPWTALHNTANSKKQTFIFTTPVLQKNWYFGTNFTEQNFRPKIALQNAQSTPRKSSTVTKLGYRMQYYDVITNKHGGLPLTKTVLCQMSNVNLYSAFS